MAYNKAIKFVSAAKGAASTGLPTLRFGSRFGSVMCLGVRIGVYKDKGNAG